MAFLPFLLPFPVTPNPTGLPVFLSYWGLTCSCKKYLVNFTQFPQHRWLFFPLLCFSAALGISPKSQLLNHALAHINCRYTISTKMLLLTKLTIIVWVPSFWCNYVCILYVCV